MAFILFLVSCTLLYLYTRISRKKHPPLPPGPPADPLIGHLRLIPAEHQETLFYEWGKKYGDVIHIHFLGRSVIILNSVEAAIDLLEKRSSNYSDRPRFVVFEIMGWLRTLSLMRYGKRFQRHRRMLQHYLNAQKSVLYRPIQTNEARILLQNLVSNDENRDDFIRRFSTAIITQVAYGHQITSDEDPYTKITLDAGHAQSNAGSPGSTPVDYFPFLQYFPSWFPGTYYAHFARENKAAVDTLHEYPFERVQQEIAEGKARPSFLAHQLENADREGPDFEEMILDIQGATGVLYCAGAETTWSSISFFIFAMILYPEIQERAQKEIDAVIGPGRLPGFEDRSSLPYLECIVQETLRWHPAVPLGVPHRSLEDDIYRDMFIPGDSLVIANTRGMTLDERFYSDPHSYNPSRYLPKPEGNNEPYPTGPFGFGRRICPGRHLADASLWIAIASILATMNITKALDKDGKEITPDIGFSCGITSQPSPYKCRIRPRNEAARSLIVHSDDY